MKMNEISFSCSSGTDAVFSESTFQIQVASFVKFISKCTVFYVFLTVHHSIELFQLPT